MTSRFDVTKKKRPFVWWQILCFSGLLIGFLLIIYPPKRFINSIMNSQIPSEVSINYLKNLITKDPDNIPIKVVLAKQEIQLGRVNDARAVIEPYVNQIPHSALQWNILWLYYQITRIEAFALKENDPQRIKKSDILKALLTTLMKSPYLTGEQAALMAEDSLAFNFTENAASFYKIAINDKHIKKSARFFAQAGKAMLYVKDYQNSSDYFLMAMQHSMTLEQKRKYYINAVDSLVSGGITSTALTFAAQHIDGLTSDPVTLIYLSKLALKANQQKAAEHYISSVLQLQYRESTP
jgi:tetratricopeptide (TPR) repeat protein